MRKVWKKIGMFFCVCIMMLTMIAGSSAETILASESGDEASSGNMVESGVFDYAGLMTAEEIAEVELQIAELVEESGWDIFALTTADAKGMTASAFAEAFYDAARPEESDGVLLLIDMDNREIYVATRGMAIRYLTDERIEWILDEGYYDVTDGEYADAFWSMLYEVDYYYNEGIETDQYNYDVETGAISEYNVLTMSEVVMSLLLSGGIGWLIYRSVAKKYRKHGTEYEYPYLKYGKVELLKEEDNFIRQHVTHRHIPRDNDRPSGGSGIPSGRSSVHTSSGGNSYGGGGRKF